MYAYERESECVCVCVCVFVCVLYGLFKFFIYAGHTHCTLIVLLRPSPLFRIKSARHMGSANMHTMLGVGMGYNSTSSNGSHPISFFLPSFFPFPSIIVAALIHRQRGNMQRSLELFQEAMRLNPSNIENAKQVARTL